MGAPILGMIGGAALQTGANLLGQKLGQGMQYKQQEKLQGLQIRGNKEMADYNKANELEMWEKTNYNAQKEQMKKAGLNPALMYGMGGTGGATTGGGGGTGVTGATAQAPNISEGVGRSAMEMGMMQSQIQLNQANAKKAEADANKTVGVDTKEAETRILDLTQGITNKKAIEKLTNVQTRLTELNTELAGRTQEDRIDQVEWESKKAFEELQQAYTETYVSQNTQNEQVAQVKASLIGTLINNKKTAEEITQRWAEIATKQTGNKIEEFKALLKAEYPSIFDSAGKAVNGTINAIIHVLDAATGGLMKEVWDDKTKRKIE